MTFSFSELLTAVQQNPNSPLMEELLERLCAHAVNYAGNKYGKRLPHALAYDFVVQGYMEGKFDGEPHRIISHVRHAVDNWAKPVEQREVPITQVVIVDEPDLNRFELVELVREILNEALSDEERAIIEARYVENRTLQEVAQQRGTTVVYVRTVENKVIHRLRHPHYAKRLYAWVR